MKGYTEDYNKKINFYIANKGKLKQIERYSSLAAIPVAGICGYSSMNLAEMVSDSPTLGIVALIASASIVGSVSKNIFNKFGEEYSRKRYEKELDDFVKYF